MRPLLLTTLLLTACSPVALPEQANVHYAAAAQESAVWIVRGTQFMVAAWALWVVLVGGVTLAVIVSVTPKIADALGSGVQAWAKAQSTRLSWERQRFYNLRHAGQWAEPSGDVELVARLLDDAIRTAGADSIVIPGWRELKASGAALFEWDSRSWQDAIERIRPHVVATEGRGGGTVIKAEYRNLATFASTIRAGRVVLEAPRPSEDSADE